MYMIRKTAAQRRVLLVTGALVLFLGLSACAARNEASQQEPEVKVRGQYDIAIGTVK